MTETVEVLMVDTEVIQHIGIRMKGERCELDAELAQQLIRQGKALPCSSQPAAVEPRKKLGG